MTKKYSEIKASFKSMDRDELKAERAKLVFLQNLNLVKDAGITPVEADKLLDDIEERLG